jgi:MFS family permease
VTPPDEAASLFRHAAFRRLWAGDAVSQLGSQLSGLALPVLAIEAFDAGAFEMGLLEASSTAAFLLIGLPAGAWVDRMRKRRVLVVADVVRAIALASLPLAIVAGVASLPQLYVVALVVGTCSVFFDVAWQSYLPVLLRGEQLVDGNAKLSATGSVAGIAGPAIGGVLLRALGASVVVLLDAISFLTSAAIVRTIEDDEQPHDPTTRRPLRSEVAEGLRFVVHHPLLVRITLCTAITNLAFSMASAVFVLFLLRDQDQSVAVVGLVYAVGSAGALLGAFGARRIAQRLGEGRTIPISDAVGALSMVFLPLAAVVSIPVVVLAAAGMFLGSLSGVVYNVTQISFRQRICPPELLGRMNASVRFLVWGTLPIGSVLGGVVAEWLGIVPTLWIAFVIAAIGVVPVALSPLARMRELPRSDHEGV